MSRAKMALNMVNGFRMQAVSATLAGYPAFRKSVIEVSEDRIAAERRQEGPVEG